MILQQRSDIATLLLAIAHSPIVVHCAAPANAVLRRAVRAELPEGFEESDLAVLRWIAEEARRAGRHLFRN